MSEGISHVRIILFTGRLNILRIKITYNERRINLSLNLFKHGSFGCTVSKNPEVLIALNQNFKHMCSIQIA